jgi:hypothetical protein
MPDMLTREFVVNGLRRWKIIEGEEHQWNSPRCHAKGYAEALSQGPELLIDGPQQSVGAEKNGRKQRQIDCSAPQVVELLLLYQVERVFGCRYNGFL